VQVTRLCSHPSLLIWCANNENEELLYNDWLKVRLTLTWFEKDTLLTDMACQLGSNKPKYFVDYYKLTIETILPTVTQIDPNTPFWASSPSNGVNDWSDPTTSDSGDMHYWGVWHGGKPLSAYLEVQLEKSNFSGSV